MIIKDNIVDMFYYGLFVLTLWRMPIVLFKFLFDKNYRLNRKNTREEVVEQFNKTLIDLPVLISIVLILITVYRIFNLFNKIFKNENKENEESQKIKNEESQKNQNEKSQKNEKEKIKIQKIILLEAKNLIIDIPFIIMGILTIWRIPLLLKTIFSKTTTEEFKGSIERRSDALNTFIDTLIDIPFLLSFSVLVLSIIHIFTIKELWKKHESRDFRLMVIYTFLKIPFHFHVIVSTYFVLFTVYRIKTCFNLISKSKLFKLLKVKIMDKLQKHSQINRLLYFLM
jgi:NADH:ubiquinone oxidoreductase subunit 5 (subunit L)/multisubunit Na+/H+ antiporter MnhA subunit